MVKLTQEDIEDLKTVLNEQFESIQRLMPLLYATCKQPKDFQEIYQDILECNTVMMEIIEGPKGGIEKLIDRTI